MKSNAINHMFVDAIPKTLEERILYIAIDYATAIHKCVCGCGNEVVTPLSPTDWKFTYDGATVSLSPSIGNWNFKCKSHYWIDRSTVRWAEQWTEGQVAAGRQADRLAKQEHHRQRSGKTVENKSEKVSTITKILRWLFAK
jgi:hypothetical protein